MPDIIGIYLSKNKTDIIPRDLIAIGHIVNACYSKNFLTKS